MPKSLQYKAGLNTGYAVDTAIDSVSARENLLLGNPCEEARSGSHVIPLKKRKGTKQTVQWAALRELQDFS